jgi:hypothetical protein
MDRRAFFSFLPAAPFGVLMAAEAMAKAPPASMAPDKALMTLTAHSPPPPVTYPSPSQLGESFANYAMSGEYLITKESVADHGYLTFSQFPVNNKLTIGKGMEVEADHNFDSETRVAMSVGKDGHLWLKINDEWKRIVTE